MATVRSWIKMKSELGFMSSCFAKELYAKYIEEARMSQMCISSGEFLI